tara:strand:+ start:163 stop:1047 length:885 start_codon:yes stop_codon:yes gene_type:complete
MNNTSPTCALKCKYTFDYPQMKLVASNETDYLEYKTYDFSNTNNQQVVYNDEVYTFTKLRVYARSLHTYNNDYALGEVLIFHQGTVNSDPLIISIPISKKYVSESETPLDTLLEAGLSMASSNELSQGVVVDSKSFSLNDLVPANKPFYSYKGVTPFSPCSTANFIIFNMDNALAVTANIRSALAGNNIISSPYYEIVTRDNKPYYNKHGATKGFGKGGDDDIYIDCQPTGKVGDTLVKVKTHTKVFDIPAMQLLLSIGTDILIGGIVMSILWYLGTKAVNSATKSMYGGKGKR